MNPMGMKAGRRLRDDMKKGKLCRLALESIYNCRTPFVNAALDSYFLRRFQKNEGNDNADNAQDGRGPEGHQVASERVFGHA